MSEAEFIVVGSGPAGVSAALPLVEAGRNVLMLDGARREDRLPASPLERVLGLGLEGLTVEDGLSPKLRTPEARRVVSCFTEANRVAGENFIPIGALARGGLSRVWGAFVAEFDAADLEGWPIGLADLAPSYARVTSRIGVSGRHDDAAGRRLGSSGAIQPPLPLGRASAMLLDQYQKGPQGNFLLGQARNAALSVALGERPGCDLRNDCLWGCPIGAIYDSRQDLARLARHANFRLEDDASVEGVEHGEAGWRLRCADGRRFAAPKLLLAAGTLGSTALAAPLLPAIPDWRLLSNPVIAAPMLLPAGLGAAPTRTHSLAQLAFFLNFAGGGRDYVSGAVYETAGLPASSFVNQLPLGRRAGEALFRFLAPGLLVAVTYFSGAFSRNRLSFDPGTRQLTVTGGFDPALTALERRLNAVLKKRWRELGAWPLPGGRLAAPGTDAHYAGSLPMGGRAPNGTSVLGELRPGLHIVDGAVLPRLPSKHATLTIMANADRIGMSLAVR